ncbi:MAG: SusC/RagA family TonB-linked outer membrane protein [Chitinophagaceae bacterium]|nr:SusC/RagA family TonB-linked outer membrane protein [Chitinophagaceae bacterium]
MKLALLIIAAFLLPWSVNSQAISLSLKNATMEKVIAEIKKQTSWHFIYTKEELDAGKPVTIQVSGATIKEVLDACFAGQPLTYSIIEQYVVIRRTEKPMEREQQPNGKVRGVVRNDSGEPLSGASINVKGTSRLTITNEKGEFALDDITKSDVLVITNVGYEPTEYSVGGAKNMGIVLQRLVNELKDVTVKVNTGYQELPKERVTGSFSFVDNKVFNQQVGTDIISRLEGIANGLLVDKRRLSNEGILIRGRSTIVGALGPLIIVDNFPYDGDIGNINPNDVESITILKDAAAASIWGTKAGNGVIVITTRKGRFNQALSIELNANITVEEKPNLFYRKIITTSEHIDIEEFLFNQGFYNSDINNTSTWPALTPVVETLLRRRNGQITTAEAAASLNSLRTFDVRDEFNKHFYQAGINHQYALTMRGGSEKIAWIFSAGHDRNQSTLADGYERINLRTEGTVRLTKRLQFSQSILFTSSKRVSGRPEYGNIMGTSNYLYPYARFSDENGNPLPINRQYRQGYMDTAGQGKLLDWKYYPLEDYKHNTSTNTTHDILVNAGLQYIMLKGLNLQLRYQFENQFIMSEFLQDEKSNSTRLLINHYSQLNRSTGQVIYKIPKGAIFDASNSTIRSHKVRTQADYTYSAGRHEINAIGGTELREGKIYGYGTRVYGYDPDKLTYSSVDYSNPYPNFVTGNIDFIPDYTAFSSRVQRFVSLFANASYQYDRKYVISLSGRRDASNLFGVNTNHRWTPLWSVGGAWNLSNEQFYKLSFLPYLRFRLTYGYSGNVDEGRTAVTTLLYQSPSIYTQTPTAIVFQHANADLRWERVRMFNAGVDFATSNKRISGSVEVYRKRGIDLFGSAPIDYTTGVGDVISKNVASMSGKGMDIELHTVNIDRPLQWTSTVFFNINTDKVTSYYLSSFQASRFISGSNTQVISALEGRPVYSVFSYYSAGLDPANGAPRGYINGQVSSDYNVLTGNNTLVQHLKYHGPALPSIFGAFRNTMTWKGVSLTVNITYKFGYYFRRESINYSDLFSQGNGHADYSKRWQRPGDENITTVPSMIYPVVGRRESFYSGSEVLVEKGDHIRLQYINASYTWDRKERSRLPFRQMQFYATVSNLGIIWRANKHDLDPDYRSRTIIPARSLAAGIRTIF